MQYVRALDGIRGIAVLLVMFFHYGYFAAGWVGVQVFFTLSGYLITSILLAERGATFRAFASRFYWRRTLRIFPLFYSFLIIIALFHAVSGAPASFPSDWVWLATYTANFARMRESDIGPYFVHIWSLAVEEQFYLIWPLLLYFLPSRLFRWAIIGFLLFTPVLRYMVFQVMVGLDFDDQYAGKAAYVLPLMQFDAFAAGAAIPLWRLDKLRNAGRWFLLTLGITVAAGFGVLASAHFWGGGAFVASLGYAHYLTHSYGYVWGYSLLNLLSALCIVCTLQKLAPTWPLENSLLVYMGKISYGMYVFHLPLLLAGEFLMELFGVGVARPVFFVAWIAVVVLVSTASYRWIEMPFLKLKGK